MKNANKADIIKSIFENFPECSMSFQFLSSPYAFPVSVQDVEEGITYSVTFTDCLRAFEYLNSEKWPKGLTQTPKFHSVENWNDWMCQADAMDFDAFLQVATIGEVVYG
jgi:hypothetical protein